MRSRLSEAGREAGCIVLPNDVHAIADAVEEVLRLARTAVFTAAPAEGEERVSELRLALVEALNNVVRHGGGPEASPVIRIHLLRQDEHLLVRIEDTGPAPPAGFLDRIAADRRGRDPPPCRLAPEALPEGGWGLMLIRASVDGIAYRREGGRNILELAKRTAPAS